MKQIENAVKQISKVTKDCKQIAICQFISFVSFIILIKHKLLNIDVLWLCNVIWSNLLRGFESDDKGKMLAKLKKVESEEITRFEMKFWMKLETANSKALT